mgnify:CR=1 FL=1
MENTFVRQTVIGFTVRPAKKGAVHTMKQSLFKQAL